tara:strand:+ start:288 stop:413 length:126 start_codon:yes stop_codon:yes gene_type:complete
MKKTYQGFRKETRYSYKGGGLISSSQFEKHKKKYVNRGSKS